MYNQPFNAVDPVIEERRQLRRLLSGVGVTFLIQLGLMFLTTIVAQGISKNSAFDINQMYNNFSGIKPTAYYLSLCVCMVIYNFLPALFLKNRLGKSFNEILPFEKLKKFKSFLYVVFGLSICVIANILTTILIGTAKIIHMPVPDVSVPYSNELIHIIINIICLSFFPAILEEFAFRGVILSALRKYGDAFAIFISAIIFGMIHGNIVQIPFAFTLGLLLGFLVVKTNSLIPSIIVHFINNLLACIYQIVLNNYGENTLLVVELVIFSILCLLGIIAFTILIRKNNDAFTIKSSTTLLTFSEKLNCFISRPSIVVSIIATLFLITSVK